MDKFGKQQNHCAFGIKFLTKPAFFAGVLSLFLFSTCGIEDYRYLEPVLEGNISWELNVRATIRLPIIARASLQYFTHFAIYYRIYISGEDILSNIKPADMSRINSTLYQDYATFLPYTNTDQTSVSTQIGTLFSNRKYYSLYASEELNDLLSDSAMEQPIVIDFAQITGRQPTIEIDGTEYVLLRTTGRERLGEIFSIKPDNDRSFINNSGLNSGYTSAESINYDVVNNSVSGTRYTYVSMYIVSIGQDPQTYIPFYSQPAHIGVFRLPDPL